MNTDPNTLEVATTEELIGELRKRTIASVILLLFEGRKDKKSATGHTEGFELWYSGGKFVALGLAERGRVRICQMMDEDERVK